MWSDIDSDADRDDFEILGEVYVDSSSTTQRWYAGRVSASGSRTGYALRVRTTSIDIYHFTGSTYTSIVGATISISSGTWAWVRFRVNGTSVRARAWAGAIGDEPTSSWQCDSTDSTYSTAGHVGLLKANNTNTQLWRKLGIGTNGDTAPSSGASPVAFSGTVPTLNGQRTVSFSQSLASYFTGSFTPFTYAVQSGTLPSGLSLDSSTGVISGTPTVTGTQTGIVVRATDASSNTADTNSFSIAIAQTVAPTLSDLKATSVTATSVQGTYDYVF
jgi:hypothetical protein